VYLPEVPFDIDRFVSDVSRIAKEKNNKVMVVLSEGIQDMEGKYVSEYLVSLNKDSFGHAQLGGVATVLAGIISDNLKIKVRPIEFSLLQRCAGHIASKTDIEEAFMAGVMAVRYAIEGESDKMVIFKNVPAINHMPLIMNYLMFIMLPTLKRRFQDLGSMKTAMVSMKNSLNM
jgi:6-phosphofructokinase 1